MLKGLHQRHFLQQSFLLPPSVIAGGLTPNFFLLAQCSPTREQR